MGKRAQQRCDRRSSASRGLSGFTLLEAMLVIAIIGLLAAIGIVNSSRFVYKARRTEAYNILKTINKAQQIYLSDAGRYAPNFEELGLEINGSVMIDPQTVQTSHYTYTLMALDQNGQTASNFRAIAAGNIDPSDDMLDVLIIENRLTVLD